MRPSSIAFVSCLDNQRYNSCVHRMPVLNNNNFGVHLHYFDQNTSGNLFRGLFIAIISRDPFCFLAQW